MALCFRPRLRNHNTARPDLTMTSLLGLINGTCVAESPAANRSYINSPSETGTLVILHATARFRTVEYLVLHGFHCALPYGNTRRRSGVSGHLPDHEDGVDVKHWLAHPHLSKSTAIQHPADLRSRLGSSAMVSLKTAQGRHISLRHLSGRGDLQMVSDDTEARPNQTFRDLATVGQKTHLPDIVGSQER